jgi:hypothetical protein
MNPGESTCQGGAPHPHAEGTQRGPDCSDVAHNADAPSLLGTESSGSGVENVPAERLSDTQGSQTRWALNFCKQGA